MRIAVIDDGIDTVSSVYVKKLLFDMEYADGRIQGRVSPAVADSHGTVVGDIIQSYAGTAAIGSVKAVPDGSGGKPEALAAAIAWCADYGVDVIHMSLGTAEWQDFIVIDRAVRAVPGHIRVAAARENSGRLSAPASLPSVWSAASVHTGERFHVIKKENGAYDICADLAIPDSLKRKHGMYTGWSNSYQAAAVTGCLAGERLLPGEPDAGLIRSVLERYSEAGGTDGIPRGRAASGRDTQAGEIPVVWVRYENGKEFRRGDMEALMDFFHRRGYFAASLRDMQPDAGGRRSFFENYRRVIGNDDLMSLAGYYQCDILLVFSGREPPDGADSLLSVSGRRLGFYDLQEKRRISACLAGDRESRAVLAGKMILTGYQQAQTAGPGSAGISAGSACAEEGNGAD